MEGTVVVLEVVSLIAIEVLRVAAMMVEDDTVVADDTPLPAAVAAEAVERLGRGAQDDAAQLVMPTTNRATSAATLHISPCPPPIRLHGSGQRAAGMYMVVLAIAFSLLC